MNDETIERLRGKTIMRSVPVRTGPEADAARAAYSEQLRALGADEALIARLTTRTTHTGRLRRWLSCRRQGAA